MLKWRLLLGVLLIAGLAALCWLDATARAMPGVWLLPLALLAAALGADEAVSLLAARGLQTPRCRALCGAVLIVFAAWWRYLLPDGLAGPLTNPLAAPLIALVACFLLVLIREVLAYDGQRPVMTSLAATAFIWIYVGLLMSFLVNLRLSREGALGIVALVSTILVVKAGDTGAYTVGRLFGRHKMTPRLSPGKTWEGFAGGAVFSCLGAWLALGPWASYVDGRPYASVGQWLGFGLVVGIAGTLGDLVESMLKREAGRKDSSTWMPGFGGILDLLDSLLVAAPLGWLFWTYGWTGH